MAQLVEHILGKDEVISSTLISSSKNTKRISLGVFLFKNIMPPVRTGGIFLSYE